MKNIKAYSLYTTLLLAVVLGSACKEKNPTENDLPDEGIVSIDLSQRYQDMEGFGASDAWSAQYVGNWPDEKRNQIADLLFSRDMDELENPRGIGLNTWRFNIGAGSKPQVGQSNISDQWRRTEGFLQDDGSFDWEQQSGQRWFLQAAKERGVENFIAFVNSPPVQLTKNGKANTSNPGISNIDERKHDEFSYFLVEVLKHFELEGEVHFDLISPVNEPQWDWDGGQEGCPYTNSEISELAKSLSAKLQESGLSTLIELPEAGDIKFLYSNATNKSSTDNQLEEFYGSGSNSLSELPNLASYIAGHSYWSTDKSDLIPQREALWEKIESLSAVEGFAMTEYCILNYEEMQGNGRDLGISPALYIARVIHYDLTVANASSWQWWLAISPYDYKDGLIYIDKTENDGKLYTSKMLYGLGNYSRFIEKGMHRVHTSQLFGKTNTSDYTYSRVMTSAFASEANDKIIVVMVNYNNWEYTSSLDIGDEWKDGSIHVYRTSATEELKHVGQQKVSDGIEIAPLSISTFVITK